MLWLRDEHELDIRCVRITPCEKDNEIFLEVETIIPLPEAERYQTQIREKRREEKRTERERHGRFTVHFGEDFTPNLPARWAAWEIVSRIVNSQPKEKSQTLEKIRSCISKGYRRLVKLDGRWEAERIESEMPNGVYYFRKEDEVFIDEEGNTWVLAKMWRTNSMKEFAKELSEEFPDLRIQVSEETPE